MRADGSEVRRLTNHAAFDAVPVWSPDGSAIVFVSDRDGTQDLYLIRPDGTGLSRLTAGAGVTKDASRWAPDASRIAFQIARGENYEIGIVRLSDRRLTEFANSSVYDGMCAWSADGRYVAFISGRDGFDGLYTAEVDGQHLLRLTATPSLNPEWRPRP